jgi:hypothetical protein
MPGKMREPLDKPEIKKVLLNPNESKGDAISLLPTPDVSVTPVVMKILIEKSSKIPAHEKNGIFYFHL